MPPSRGANSLITAVRQCDTTSLARPPPWGNNRRYSAVVASRALSRKPAPSIRPSLHNPRTRLFRDPITFQTRLNSTAPPPLTSEQPWTSAEGSLTDGPGILSDTAGKVVHSNDYVGFLSHDYGIDFGFGTSTLLKTLYEMIHVYSGLPFWASIVLTGLAVRSVMIPTTAATADNAARMQSMMPLTKPLMDQAKEASMAQDHMRTQKIRVQLRELYKESGVKMWKFALPMIQIPLGFGCWRTFRNMAEAPVSGMESGGLAWFSNLTVADPFYLLPIMTAGLQYASVKTAQENQMSSTSELQKTMQKYMMYGLPVLTVAIIGFAPAAVQLHFLTTSLVAYCTNVLFKADTFRRLFGVTRMPKKTAGADQSRYKGTITVQGSSSSATGSNSQASKPGLLRKVTGGAAGIMTSARNTLDKAWPKREERHKRNKEKREKTRAKDYEAKRQKEIEEERVGWEVDQDSQASTRRRR